MASLIRGEVVFTWDWSIYVVGCRDEVDSYMPLARRILPDMEAGAYEL